MLINKSIANKLIVVLAFAVVFSAIFAQSHAVAGSRQVMLAKLKVYGPAFWRGFLHLSKGDVDAKDIQHLQHQLQQHEQDRLANNCMVT